MTIEDIALLCEKQSVRWTDHMLERIFRRGINMVDVISALTNGGSNGEELWLITAYFPNLFEWTEDFKRMKNK